MERRPAARACDRRGRVPIGRREDGRAERGRIAVGRPRESAEAAGPARRSPASSRGSSLPEQRAGAAEEITFRLFVEIDMTGPKTYPCATITRMAHTLTNIDSVYGI